MAASLPKLRNDHIDSPYFIFIRSPEPLQDRVILRALGLHYVRICRVGTRELERSLFITGDGIWSHVPDSWFYSLWHKRVERELSERLPKADIFACSTGDCDYSFDFHYYLNGQLRRAYEVDDPLINKHSRRVVRDIGEPLIGEKPLAAIQSEQDYVLSLAANLGIKPRDQVEEIRCYKYSTNLWRWLIGQ